MHTQPYFCKKVLVYNHDTMPILHKPHPHGTGGVIIQQGLRVVISQLIESKSFDDTDFWCENKPSA